MSIDLNDPAVQAAIAAAVRASLASAGVTAPEPPKVLTPIEKAKAQAERATARLASDSGNIGEVIRAIVDAILALIEHLETPANGGTAAGSATETVASN